MWEARFLPPLPLRHDGLQRLCRAASRRLDKVRVKVRLAANVVVGAAVELSFARFDVSAVVVSVLNDVVRGPLKLLNRLVKKAGVALGHIEFDRDGAPDLHTSYVTAMIIKGNIPLGVGPATGDGSIVNRTRFLPP